MKTISLTNKLHLITSLILLLSLLFTTAPAPLNALAASGNVNLSIDVAANRKPISPYIYGLNFAKESFAAEIGLPVRRWGGNATSRYNWKTGNTNSGNDWYYENSAVTQAYDWDTLEDYNGWVQQNLLTNTESIITIPMLGYVSKDATSCGFNKKLYGSQTDSDHWHPKCGNGINGSGNITGNNPLDTSIAVDSSYMQNWVTALVKTYGSAGNGGVRFYALDNEPELWSDTHRDVHPNDQTYDELLAKSIDYGSAIKTADPGAQLLGYVSFGWSGYWYSWHDLVVAAGNDYTYFPDYATHENLYQVEWYLDQMYQYQQDHSQRLLDYLDLHFYPDNGVSLQTAGGASLQALRLRSTRALWDPTYRDESWIGGNDQEPDQRYVRLIPRMHGWVDTYYPGTKLAITEYNWGGLESINGALAQADILGIFGREGVDLANLWNYPLPDGSDTLGYDHFESLPGAYAFRMFRNYDGSGGQFGETGISAVNTNQAQLSVYAAQRESDSALTIVAINKTGGSINSNVNLANFIPNGNVQVYSYGTANLNSIIHQPDLGVDHSGLTYTFPANSITLFVIPPQTNTAKLYSSEAGADGWILESSENSGQGGAQNSSDALIYLGDNAANKQYRSVLSFDTSSLPAGSTITKLTLNLRKAGVAGGGNPIKKFKGIYVDMVPGLFGNISLELSDFNSAPTQTYGPFKPALSGGWYSIDISDGKDWINGSGITQLRLRFNLDDNNNYKANYIKLFSGDADIFIRPKLVIEFITP